MIIFYAFFNLPIQKFDCLMLLSTRYNWTLFSCLMFCDSEKKQNAEMSDDDIHWHRPSRVKTPVRKSVT
jgi:hypothetical protein